jgi:hypothetical protein
MGLSNKILREANNWPLSSISMDDALKTPITTHIISHYNTGLLKILITVASPILLLSLCHISLNDNNQIKISIHDDRYFGLSIRLVRNFNTSEINNIHRLSNKPSIHLPLEHCSELSNIIPGRKSTIYNTLWILECLLIAIFNISFQYNTATHTRASKHIYGSA